MKRNLGLGLAASCLLGGIALTQALPASGPVLEPRDAETAARLQREARVLLVTLDGPQTADVFSPTHLPLLHAALKAKEGALQPAMAASPMALSLPGYQALATGRITPCFDNDCDRVSSETVAEYLARRLGGGAEQFAVFASWSRLARAVSARDENRVLVDAPPDQAPSANGPPWPNARFDADTFARAVAHWVRTKPRFMQISLLDTDEWAHRGQRVGYEEALTATDQRLAQLRALIAELPPGERERTTLLATADHGRAASDWRHHGPRFPKSRQTFFATFPARGEVGDAVIDQRDVRPTIERLFGLCTVARRRADEGHPITAAVGQLPCTD